MDRHQVADLGQFDVAAGVLDELTDSGALSTPEMRALGALVAGVAQAVDAQPENAALWRELRMVWADLREGVAAHGASDDSLMRALASFDSSAAVFDPPAG